MNETVKKYLIIGSVAIILIGGGYGAGKYSNPSKVETVTQVKEVIKYVETKQENKDLITRTKKITMPDGTIVEKTISKDKSITNTDTKKDTIKESKVETITTRDLGLSVQALTLAKFKEIDNREYGVLIKKRIFSNISGTILATHKGTIGIAIGLDW